MERHHPTVNSLISIYERGRTLTMAQRQRLSHIAHFQQFVNVNERIVDDIYRAIKNKECVLVGFEGRLGLIRVMQERAVEYVEFEEA